MNIFGKRFAGICCALGLILGAGVGTISASATSVGDVIAHARAVGMPESMIQSYTNQGLSMGREFTSEECDQAIAALDQWAAERNSAIEDTLNESTASAEESSSAQTTTTAVTEKVTQQQFIDMTIDEKVSYVNSLPDKERTDFINNMSNEERNSFLKQMDTSKQADVIASLLDVGDAFGLTFSVDELSGGSAAISARDASGNLVGVTTFGDTVEQTGTSYTVPIAVGGGAILLAAAGMGAVLFAGRRKGNCHAEEEV